MTSNVRHFLPVHLVRFGTWLYVWYVLVRCCTFGTFWYVVVRLVRYGTWLFVWYVLVRFCTSACRVGFFDMKLSLEGTRSYNPQVILTNIEVNAYASVKRLLF
jgi:hypothetical protein